MTTLIVPKTQKLQWIGSEHRLIETIGAGEEGFSLEEHVTLLLMRDLVRLGWRLRSQPASGASFEFVPPRVYRKQVVREAMAFARNAVLAENSEWIAKHLPIARQNMACGEDVLKSEIYPQIEICHSRKQRDLFRLFRYYWSSPYSEYVGRRIRILIRDAALPNSPVIGIAALGSSIIHIPDRDQWIGWDKHTRTERIVYMMDAYILGALPPYNYLLGGKLISYVLASNELREIHRAKYSSAKTILRNREASELVLLVTTSLYGPNSSQYNRLKFRDSLLYQPIGETAGYGSLHISNETFFAMRQLLTENGIVLSNRFGDGSNWRMRVIRTTCNVLGLNSEVILQHSFRRGLFAVPLATNWREFLNGDDDTPEYRNLSLADLVNYWKDRWLKMRKTNDQIIEKVRSFSPDMFDISQTFIDSR